MQHISLTLDQNVLTIRMARGKANALNGELIGELMEAVTEATSDGYIRALVLASDRPRFFSAGFDVNEVFQYDRERLASFFGRFTDLYEALYRCPKGVVAALNGHTFAGGAILAIACDFRVMADGDYGFALNEINLGLVVSAGIGHMLADAVGVGRAREILLTGEALGPRRACEIGLVHELAPEEQVLERAQARARLLAEKPPLAFAEMKRALREAHGPGANAGDRLGAFVDLWFGPEAQERRRQVLERMKTSKGG